MDRYYSQFWLEYCSNVSQLNPEFKERDEESENFYNVRGRVVTTASHEFVINGHAVCDIEGKQI